MTEEIKTEAETEALAEEKPRGKFIVLEGPDGVGKTTQAHLLVGALRKGGADVLYTKEPTDGRAGILALEAISGKNVDPREQVTLLAADRRRHCREVIDPALEEGKIVICDRFTLSTHVYQTFSLFEAFLEYQLRIKEAQNSQLLNHALDLMDVAKMYCEANKWISDVHVSLPVPDLYVVLLASPDVIESRIKARGALSDQDRSAAKYGSAYSFIVSSPKLASIQAESLAALDAGTTEKELADAIFNLCSRVL